MENNMFTIWMTGLSGAGKTTIAAELLDRLRKFNHRAVLLDGDDLRFGLCKDLGFSAADRKENIRRISEVARLMNDGGLNVIVACISPYEADRQEARAIIGVNHFIEVYISTPLEECERRDRKGLYAKARAGKLADFTGISAPYEVPTHANISINTLDYSVEDAVSKIMKQSAPFFI